jgi:hypothetical protein
MTIRLPSASRDAAVDAVTSRADLGAAAGKLRIYTGAQPASANDAASGTLLVEIPLPDPSFVSGGTGTNTLNDPASVNATAAGVAGWFRVLDSDNNTVLDGSAGATGSGMDLILANTNIAVGQPVDIQSGGTVVMPAG